MDAVIYTRVSRDSAGGRSVEDQERECRQECNRNNWPVRAVYCDNSIGAISLFR
ncbi:recombinase family protein [Mycobacterium sherrisii]|uniref:recombinase family protein n=1 Tax=Mycobacterium sherrisii TaxID=243061 RepID=UPI001301DCF9|nr:recombinase family protein [Mycobacterium sherrisii]